MKLVGDLGGTKVLLALVDAAGEIRHERRLASADFVDFEALLTNYLAAFDIPIEGGCLAVAGPVADDGRAAKLTNLPWFLDCATLETRLGLGPLRLINDFAGVAHGVAIGDPARRLVLQTGRPLAHGVKLVLGAGTGLGMAVLVPEADGYRVLPGEGGHVGFAPANAEQAELWRRFHGQTGRVTAERVISGPGLVAIHAMLSGETCDPPEIVALARAGNATAERAVATFLAAYGGFAGDMAMALQARGGVILSGGITLALLPWLRDTPWFLEAFNAKAEHAELARAMPVWVEPDAEVGLKGAVAQLR